MLKIIQASDLVQEVQQLYDTGLPRGDKTGWIELDQYYSIAPGYCTVVTGIPSVGKSTFMDNLMANTIESGWKWVVYSPENLPPQVHIASIMEKMTGNPIRRGYSTRISPEAMGVAISKLDDCARFLSLPEASAAMPTLAEFLEVVDEALSQFYEDDKVAVLLDPWNEVDHSLRGGISETEYINYALSTWRQFHRAHNTHGFIVAHPTKIQRIRNKDGSTGNFIVPSLYDINGSAAWFNKTDNGIVLWRDDEDPGSIEVHVKKVRFRHHGRTGVAYLDYNSSTGIYTDQGARPYNGYRPKEDWRET